MTRQPFKLPLLCIAALFAALLSLGPARAEPRDEVVSRVAAGIAELRRAAGPNWPVKAARADRVIAGVAWASDTLALAAEAGARGKGETTAQLAALQASRRDRYVAALAQLDGLEVGSLDRLNAGDDGADVLAAVDAAIAAALATLPARE